MSMQVGDDEKPPGNTVATDVGFSSLSRNDDSSRSGTFRQMTADSEKMYGPDDTEFVRLKGYEFPGQELSKGGFLRVLTTSMM